jgi:carboxylesterase type B
MPITGRKIPIVGSMHGMDIVLNMFGDPSSNFKPTEIIMTSVISFVNDLDPNNDASGNTPWPRYTSEAKQMYHIKNSGADVIRDDFRSIEIQYLMDTENFQL